MDEEETKDLENSSAESEQTNSGGEMPKEEKKFTRDEVNKMINAEKQRERQAVLKEFEAQKAEADKLAKMDADQKKSYELEQERARANKAESELNAYRLKDETVRQANQRGISIEYLETIDFTRENAESIKTKLDIFERVSKSDREKAISEYSKEPTPQTGEKRMDKDISQMSYTELAEYLSKHPDVKL